MLLTKTQYHCSVKANSNKICYSLSLELKNDNILCLPLSVQCTVSGAVSPTKEELGAAQ